MVKKTFIITGASSGMGKEIALSLATDGAHVLLICRDPKKGKIALDEIKTKSGSDSVELFIADISSLQQIRTLSEIIHKRYSKIHGLINNAGIIHSNKQLSKDGIEMTFATNYLGPFLLTYLLSDLLKAGNPARVINISSLAHKWADIDLNDLQFQHKQYHFKKAYSESKLLLIIITYEFAKRLKNDNITVNCMHPGTIRTQLLNDFATNSLSLKKDSLISKMIFKFIDMIFISPKKAAEDVVYLATSTKVQGMTGKYFVKCKPRKSAAISYNAVIANNLWNLSKRMANIDE